MASAKSMTDIAYDILSKKKRAVQFIKLWEDVAKIYGAPNEKVSQFYADLTYDSRFANLKDNKWDLVERRKYSEVHSEISNIEIDNDIELYDDEDSNNE